ncbi:hypothetical protein ACQ4PT_010325 [Festuca glaucescens]
MSDSDHCIILQSNMCHPDNGTRLTVSPSGVHVSSISFEDYAADNALTSSSRHNIRENGDDITDEYGQTQDMLEGDDEDDEGYMFSARASTATPVNLLELQGLVYAKELIVEDAAGAFAKIAVAPLERVKNLLQARTGGFQSLGIIGSLRKLWKYK